MRFREGDPRPVREPYAVPFADLPPDTVVLTPHDRLARHLRAREDRQHPGETAWEPREILAWKSWLGSLWDEALPLEGSRPVLLRPAQEAALWQQVLEDSPQGERLLNPRSASRTAAEAWRLLQDHGARLDPADPFLDEDSRAFAAWAAEFRRRCDHAGWLDSARLAEALEEALQQGGVLLPPGVALVGFDEIPPRQARLLEALERAGCEVERREPDGKPGHFLAARFPDPDSELLAVARWARGLLDRDPHTRVGLVVPDLGGLRIRLERALEDVLCPEVVLPERARRPRPFNVSLGGALADRGLVQDALALLHLARSPLPLAEVGALLRSPHLGGAETEAGRRGLLDAALRRRRVPSAGLERLGSFARATDAAGAPRPHACPLLAERLEALGQATHGTPDRQSPARWTEAFDRWLQAAGWPGERPLDSEDLQAVQRFRETLAELRGLDLVRPSMTFLQALGALTSLCREAIFQPRGPEAPVQVLGFLEAAGLDFDATWLVGVHDEVWPPAARPNPYLPADLQRRLGMPHSSPNRELEFARRVTRRILAGAPEGVASHAGADGDRELRPSALLRHLPEGMPRLRPAVLWREELQASGERELAPDRPPPPLAPGAVARGGTRLFKLQAACPFRAFAELRLGAQPLEPVQPGLDARERGVLVHAVLEGAWKVLGTHERLVALPPEELQALALEAAEGALARLQGERPDLLHGRFRALERERLARLALEWLAVERERSPFRVLGFEQSVRMEVAGLEFDAQIDRLDRLSDGSLAVLDYKTGEPRLKDWLGDRPEEPQLLLYCTGAGERPGAVLFAQVRPGDMRFKGLSERPGVHPQVTSFLDSDFAVEARDWDDLLERWRAVLRSLGAGFRQGHAPVTPLKRETCRHCTLHPLCRVHELRPLDEGRGSTPGKDASPCPTSP